MNHLTEHGVMGVALLYESPFTDIAPHGPDDQAAHGNWSGRPREPEASWKPVLIRPSLLVGRKGLKSTVLNVPPSRSISR